MTETNGHNATVSRLTPAQVKTAAAFSRTEIMAMVGLYYSIQKVRIGASNRESAHQRRADTCGDPVLIGVLKEELKKVEMQAALGLKEYARAQPLGQWALQILGVGPVICAGLLAHIDLTIAKSAGCVWSFAGLLDPEQIKWEKGQKRPYNAALKTLCWKLGESFKKISKESASSGNPEALYAGLYRQRKELEVQRNNEGVNRDRAHRMLEKAKAQRWGISEEQKKVWGSGKLQDVGLDLRAMRYAVKFFLSHWHHVGSTILFGKAPEPWIIKFGGHTDYVPPPLWPMEVKKGRKKVVVED